MKIPEIPEVGEVGECGKAKHTGEVGEYARENVERSVYWLSELYVVGGMFRQLCQRELKLLADLLLKEHDNK